MVPLSVYEFLSAHQLIFISEFDMVLIQGKPDHLPLAI